MASWPGPHPRLKRGGEVVGPPGTPGELGSPTRPEHARLPLTHRPEYTCLPPLAPTHRVMGRRGEREDRASRYSEHVVIQVPAERPAV